MTEETMATTDRIVLSYHNSLLRESDVNLLNGPYWLNDKIISFYMEYLEHDVYKQNPDFLFITPEVVQVLKFLASEEIKVFLSALNIFEKQFIFLPWNDNDTVHAGGTHWSLFVFSRPDSTFYYFDSFPVGGMSLRALRTSVAELAAAFKCPEFDVRRGECIQQNNFYDCGIHVLVNVELLAKRAFATGTIAKNSSDEPIDDDPMRVTNLKLRQKRKAIVLLINELSEQGNFS